MNLIPIEVQCHSGYKEGEYPTSFYWMHIRYDIQEIADRWIQAQSAPGSPLANYFKVRTASKSVYILKHDLEADKWYLVSQDKPFSGFSAN